uniref:NADH-ubiquinone oxidoreductase chain 5 n=1 Tax=Malassezia furfur TaxID=55194 RepID=A0A2I6QC56_MALFU|nr:NADH dehydrogenase subunit 5 [Malassezia furfur]AUN27963.1 NADH dehydrogenase subunit 5 [Malassezia furfur]AUN28009.1 NADH dehydrogenase subunit 5 [Malassezia furfur]AUN28030.1 NADH dehydrogenase subunit 5 [Malassezia furfur]UBU96472.1 NADH dehydrogenase subunit 5 [Malassezia furfur]UBU96514.1 NADH dehydrogenase subunit 5 [Malassezia furfur]
MYLTFLFLPFLGAASAGLLGRKLGVTGAHIITTSCLAISAALSIVAFYEVVLCHSPVTIKLGTWIQSEILSIDWSFTFDTLSISIISTVLLISSLVHLYSIDYMSSDPHNQRFFSYLSLFTFFMVLLLAGDNYFVLFLGWEFIAVCSYLLINFWFTIIEANKSAMQSFIVNRVGDMALTVSFFAMFFLFGNVDFTTVFSLAPIMNESALTIIGILLLMGGMGKSAQIGLNTWLPTAMAGPTPVSSLIHSATLVSAGVYVLLRSSPLLEYSPTALIAITWIGSITAFFAASTGLLQNDLKRVIAYSTCSQMGYLFLACGLSQYNTALFHLVNHAFFKALLFLSAGAVLHATFDQQDQRRLGGLLAFLPFTYTAILIGSLSLMAIPFMTGFYSKDLILELAYSQYLFKGTIAYWFGSISAGLTAFYSFRLVAMTFLTYPNSPKKIYESTHDAAIFAMIPMTTLAILAIFFGYVAKDLFVGMGTDFAGTSLFIHPNHISLIEAEVIPTGYKLLPSIITFASATGAYFAYHYAPKMLTSFADTNLGYNLYKFFNGKYYIEVLYNTYLIPGALGLGYVVSKQLDRGLIEQIFGYGLTSGLSSTSKQIGKLDDYTLPSYAVYFALSLVILTILLIVPIVAVFNTSDTQSMFNMIYSLMDIRLILLFILTTIFVV